MKLKSNFLATRHPQSTACLVHEALCHAQTHRSYPLAGAPAWRNEVLHLWAGVFWATPPQTGAKHHCSGMKACSLVIYHSALTKHGCNAPGVSEDSHTQSESVLSAHGQREAGPGQFASSKLRAAWHFCFSTKSLWMQSSSAVKC